jgi:predicted outer membrane protein
MHIDMAQRGFAEIAAERAGDERVRAFARELVDYHSRSYDRLAQLASARGVEPLRELSAVSQGTQNAMRRQGSPMLDWTFLNAQAFTSYGAHYRYEREAIHGRDPELRDLAAAEARTSREQHQRALDIINSWSWDAPAP